MKKHILCLGDSNTHGYCADPADCNDSNLSRFNENERWTCLLQQKLGSEYLVIEEGLSGRTTVFEDPVSEGMPALPYLYPCLKSHEPVDLLIVMLGTNDVKERMGTNSFVVGQGMLRLIKKALSIECWADPDNPQVLIIAPPPIGDGLYTSQVAMEMGTGAVEKSQKLADEYKNIANQTKSHFIDASSIGCTFNEIDYMHLTKASHSILAEALHSWIIEHI